MESITPDEAQTDPSPQRRLSHELVERISADPSLTRKRPRLESSADKLPAMANSSPAEANNMDQPVEMTIRSQPPSSSQPQDDSESASTVTVTAPATPPQVEGSHAEDAPADPAIPGGDAAADSPPVEAVEDDEALDTLDDFAGTDMGFIEVEIDEEDHFRAFPYTQHGNYGGAIRAIITHLQGTTALEGSALPQLAKWLDEFPHQPARWTSAFYEKVIFWDDLSVLMNKILNRRYDDWQLAIEKSYHDNTHRYSLGEGFGDYDDTVEGIFSNFFRSYLQFCARFLEADAALLSQYELEPTHDPVIVSYKHLKHIFTLFRMERSPIFHLLQKEYGIDTTALGNKLVCEFIQAPTNGLQHLLGFAFAACNHLTPAARTTIFNHVSPILACAGWSLHLIAEGGTVTNSLPDRGQFHQDLLRYFKAYNVHLQDPGKVVDVTAAKEMLGFMENILLNLCTWDHELAAELAGRYLDFRVPDSPTSTTMEEAEPRAHGLEPENYPFVVSAIWKFKLLKKYIVKGRMELRVVSIGAMDLALVDIWREHNNSLHGTNHPVMQYFAEFLLHEKLVDYIISVDSHPQLISRSGNIVGFLVVTQRYSESQTDAIWKTVSNSPDPRVVTATIAMLRGIISLMHPAEILYLCLKLYELPLESYTVDILRFLREITAKLTLKYMNLNDVDPRSRPWTVCIRLLQDTSPSRHTTTLTHQLHLEASEQLGHVSAYVDGEERYKIYDECATHIAKGSDKATGSVRAINILHSRNGYGGASFFSQNQEVTRHILEELCSFVRSESELEPASFQISALQYRLDLLGIIVLQAPDAVPSDLYQDLWDHLIGKYALSSQLRNMAWAKFSEMFRYGPDNKFCKLLLQDCVPNLEPKFFTDGLFEFVAGYDSPPTRRAITTSSGVKELLQIPGAELLWPILLTAPQGTIEDRSAKLLASRYVEIVSRPGVALEEVEEAHAALAEQCTKELLSSHKMLRTKARANASTVNNLDQMDITLSDDALKQNELRFQRTLLFEKLLLDSIRHNQLFCRSRRTDSKVEPLEFEQSSDATVEIKYQAGDEKSSIFMDVDSTFQAIYARICQLTGFTKINVFCAGQKLNLERDAFKGIAELKLDHGLLLVQKAPGSDTTQPSNDSSIGCSVFEVTVLKHFEELFACMDADDVISEALFDFLSCFPFRERVSDAIVSDDVTAINVFPPGKTFQAKYAALAFRATLKDQMRRNALDENFLANAVKLLSAALLNENLMSSSLYGEHELQLAAVLVMVLLEFLKVERPHPDISVSYFADQPQLVHRLVSILTTSLVKEYDRSTAVAHCYAAILEASLHSRVIWDAFMARSDIQALHQTLLLADPRKHLREQIAQTIASVCGGDLPSTSPLTGPEAAARFWTIISALLPEAVQRPNQAEQLFAIAEQLFRRHDEYSRQEESLRKSLSSWGDLLLHYRHHEVVGRDDVDFVVLGLTKLLLCCVSSLKSFKKPLNAGTLMEQIFQKFLFIPRITEIDEAEDDDNQHLELPVLESKTRKELYDLVLALAEDRHAYGKLLTLTQAVTLDDSFEGFRMYGVDRSNEIRSSTGYVGLYNPRAICYMNSLITQLFMNVNFRKFMLSLDVADGDASQRLLSETQKLFALMQNSFLKSADPREFASCVKGLDSAPIDINIQMDADEFYNLLFDQWEGQMLSPDAKQHFRSFYGGQTVNQIKSKECEHVSERVESFFVVQCDVQGKATLQDSLQAFVEGDVMEGDNKYKCESCGGKFVDAVKRTCLKDVPDNLIFHLKRFDFDLVDMRRAKINDHFEFPNLIDVSLYNVEYLSDPSKPPQEDIFELVGVLVHMGTSENGHYYSYIRERPCSSEGKANWVEFNDRDVDPFDPATIARHAFGGPYEDPNRYTQKTFSAYMLFYQRKSAIEKDHQEYISSPLCGPPKVPVPPELEKDICAKNREFVRQYSQFDPNHPKFIRQLLATLRTVNYGTCSEDHQQETQALNIVLEHLCEVISRLRDLDNFDETLAQLRKTALSCSLCCHLVLKWLAYDDNALLGLLLRSPTMKVRSTIRAFLIDCMRFLREKDPTLYGLDSMDLENDSNSSAPTEGLVFDLVGRLRYLTAATNCSARGWDDIYLTLIQVGEMGLVETALILNHAILDTCLRILCMHAYAPFRSRDPDMWRLVEKKRLIFNRVTEFVWAMLSKMDITLDTIPRPAEQVDRLQEYNRSKSKFPLCSHEAQILHFWHDDNKAYAVLDKMLETFDCTRTQVFYPGEVLKWMMNSTDRKIPHQLYITVKEGIAGLNPPQSDNYVRAALPYCQTCPDLNRVSSILSTINEVKSASRESGGEVRIALYKGLLTLHNEVISNENHVDFFYDVALQSAPKYIFSLLMYDGDIVRNEAAKYVESLFTCRPDEEASEDSILLKYQTVRHMIKECIRRIAFEHDNGTSRNFMTPMLSVCHTLAHVLITLIESDVPSMEMFKNQSDVGIIQQYQGEIELRCRTWVQDEETPMSAGGEFSDFSQSLIEYAFDCDTEAFDGQSEYGSESDDGPDLE
ncbi:hypothetical protein P154DRAFT_298816 [Amniculicola lignicola CBS 123094]|uniref:USP domain-containing protein n=1 Tax=Amniculicola lignicola CBS 123094 TaxID=1392246 RepID=A0A6A5W8C1_9PLEO|nr:hypothetical protein P154DRAFT_298816 [Amniculicola lignicola CBS 123094]